VTASNAASNTSNGGAHADELRLATATAAEATAPVPRSGEEPTPARIEAFSDSVFAIIITLLVLDLRVPREEAIRGTWLGDVLRQEWPTFIAFVLSFLQVGVVWANHHAMFHYIRRSDHRLLVYNLLLLLCAAVLPFTSSLLAEYARADEADLRLAALLYSGALFTCGVFFNVVWQHALNAKLVSPHADPYRLHALRQHWLLVPVFYAIAFVLAFVHARVSLGMYVLLLFYYGLPGPVVVRRVTARGRARAAAARAAA
jgi:uncharacterized membrane protein